MARRIVTAEHWETGQIETVVKLGSKADRHVMDQTLRIITAHDDIEWVDGAGGTRGYYDGLDQRLGYIVGTAVLPTCSKAEACRAVTSIEGAHGPTEGVFIDVVCPNARVSTEAEADAEESSCRDTHASIANDLLTNLSDRLASHAEYSATIEGHQKEITAARKAMLRLYTYM